MTTPASGGLATDGGSYQVGFDTEMQQTNASKVLKIKGCGASISGAQWVSPQFLSYTINIPTKVKGTQATITVNHADAVAGSPGFPNELDGNSNGTNGQAPNKTNYTWTVSCSNPNGPPGCDYSTIPINPQIPDADFVNCWLVGSGWTDFAYTCGPATCTCAPDDPCAYGFDFESYSSGQIFGTGPFTYNMFDDPVTSVDETSGNVDITEGGCDVTLDVYTGTGTESGGEYCTDTWQEGSGPAVTYGT